jgi:hypothetical protein
MSYTLPTHFRNINISALRIPFAEASLSIPKVCELDLKIIFKNLPYFSLAFVKVEHS